MTNPTLDKLIPIQASPEFIRDNQYEDGYIVITEDYYPVLFDAMVASFGSEMVMNFPSGRECFFCKMKHL